MLRHAIGARSARRVVVDGVSLAYDDVGRGPAIVCLHAIGHGAGDYARLATAFADRHRVVALDWPGHGASGDDRAPASAERYAALLPPFLDAIGVDRAVVIGNSVGGAAAIRFAVESPARVRGLVLANPGGIFRRSIVSRLGARALAATFAAGARGAGWYPRFFGAYYARILRLAPSHEQRARIVAASRELAPMLAEAWRSFADDASDLRPLLAEVRAPVLVAWALRDPVNGLSLNRASIARFPDARLATFADAGHAPFLEAPEAFDPIFARFLADVA